MLRKSLLLALFGGILGAAGPAAAQYGPEGAPHAKRFTYTCPAGHYLVGLSGNASDHLDKVVPICAPFAEGRLGGQILGPAFGQSFAGAPTSAICKANNAVSGIRSDLPYVQLTCSSIVPPHAPDTVKPELGPGSASGPHRVKACAKGELATGIQGRAGQYVDDLGLVCGPPPQ